MSEKNRRRQRLLEMAATKTTVNGKTEIAKNGNAEFTESQKQGDVSLSKVICKTAVFLKSNDPVSFAEYHAKLGIYLHQLGKVILDNPGYLAIASGFVVGFCTFADQFVKVLVPETNVGVPILKAQGLDPLALTLIGILSMAAMWLASIWSLEKYKVRKGFTSLYAKPTRRSISFFFTLLIPFTSLVLQSAVTLQFASNFLQACAEQHIINSVRLGISTLILLAIDLLTLISVSYSLPRINDRVRTTTEDAKHSNWLVFGPLFRIVIIALIDILIIWCVPAIAGFLMDIPAIADFLSPAIYVVRPIKDYLNSNSGASLIMAMLPLTAIRPIWLFAFVILPHASKGDVFHLATPKSNKNTKMKSSESTSPEKLPSRSWLFQFGLLYLLLLLLVFILVALLILLAYCLIFLFAALSAATPQ